MTHDSAVRTIVDLVPQIDKKGADAVLLEHAERENLPPAQLEKLAQVFNTLRTLDHIDKQASAEGRGSAVNLVDVPVLVASYVLRTNQEKSAAPLSSTVSSHNPSTVDLMSAVRFDAPQIKAASAAVEPTTRKLTNTEICDAALDLAIDARNAMEKVATALLNSLPELPDGSRDISAAIADARPHCSAEALQQSVAWLKSASAAPLVGAELDLPLVKRAFAVTGNSGKLLVEFNSEHATCQLMRKLASSVDKYSDKKTGSEPARTPEEIEEELNKFYEQHGLDPYDSTEPSEFAEPTPRPTFVTDSDTGDVESGKAGVGGAAVAAAEPKATANLSKVLNAIGAPIREAGNLVTGAANLAQAKVDAIASKERTNKDQQRSDLDVEDVRRAIGIRRMIGTDPVLRESDPREVLEIYNAISRTNPEIVGNMPALRLLLREAVSYEGLTLDSQKQLTDIRQNTSKSEMQEADNLKRRYASGGVDMGRGKTK